jgi:hypothetical protein
MGRYIALAALVLAFAVVGSHSAAADDPKLPVKLGERPKAALLPRPPVSDAQKRHIRELIAYLAKLDRPDFGLSATMSGTEFAPIPGQQHAEAFLLTNHGLKGLSALKELVTLGADALPLLLDSLDDRTPTKVVVKHESMIGVMSFARELPVNPVNPTEAAIRDVPDPKETIVDEYTIKVGDVCFVAIGQIVGRGYQAVRYQPTACIVLNSPTHDAKLCANVRAMWKSDDPRRKLFDSFCTDYATVGIFNGDSLDGWGVASTLQCSAALRMLFYFPRETAALIAGRLDKLNVARDTGIDDYIRRCVANGVVPEDFIRSVAWSREPAIRSALTRLFKRAGDLGSLMAAMPGTDDNELIRRRLEEEIITLPADDRGPFGDANHLLTALMRVAPDSAKAMFVRYLQNPTAQRRHGVCVTLRNTNLPWDIELLLPMLSDTRTFGWTYAVAPSANDPNQARLQIRVCDAAAVTLSQNHPELTFTQTGQYADLDKQIAVMKAALTGKRK